MTKRTERLVIKNGRVLLTTRTILPADVSIVDGRIAEIGVGLSGERTIDAMGAYVLPGLIDLHTHGIGFESCDSETLHGYARAEAEQGATTFFPTLFAAPDKAIAQMQRHRAATNDLRDLPQVGGFRLESPYLGYAGGGLNKDLAPISAETTQALLDAGGGLIKIWDISPELPGALDVIRVLAAMGITCSMAHTRATIAEARAAIDAGLRLITHFYDTFVVPEMTEPGAYPAGLTDYLLSEDRVVCEIIGDGTHVHPLLVEMTFRCKTAQRIAFVTDSNYGAGLPAGQYTLPNDWGPVAIAGPNNGVRLVERGMTLAGSALTPIEVFHNAVHMFGKDIATASQVCSATPARLLKLNKGEIAVGKDADLIIVDPDLNLLCTVVAGHSVFSRQ